MKKILLGGLILSMCVQPALLFADNTLPHTKISMQEVVSNIKSSGYQSIENIELNKDLYTAQVVNEFGQDVQLTINANTGHVQAHKLNRPTSLSLYEAILSVQKKGFTNINGARYVNGFYLISATSNSGKLTELSVNAKTGDILSFTAV